MFVLFSSQTYLKGVLLINVYLTIVLTNYEMFQKNNIIQMSKSHFYYFGFTFSGVDCDGPLSFY